MSESTSHKAAKGRGMKKAKKEVPISRNRRLDARSKTTAREVERSGTTAGLAKAVSRLVTQKNLKKELVVPQKDMDLAKEVAEQKTKAKITIKNMGGTKRKYVNK